MLAACADQPTSAPADLTFGLARGQGQGGGRQLVTSGARYSDTSVKPAIGRSGSAAITAQAVFSSSGTTDLVVRSYRAADAAFATPVGCINKIQVKAFSADGRLAWTRNFNNLKLASGAPFTTSFTDLVPGMTLEVQVNVQCIDNRRTDVVTASPAVIRRTDPAVTAVSVPSQALVNTPSLVVGRVTELNGDLGAFGTCVLYVDDVRSESIPRVWVNAGGSVDCRFAPTRSVAGTYALRVTFEDVAPRDDNLANNAATGTLLVVGSVPPPPPPDTGGGPPPPPPPPVLMPYRVTANVYDDTVNTSTVILYSLRDPATGALLDTMNYADSRIGNEQYARFTGMAWASVPFPLANVSFSMVSGAHTFDAFAATNVPSNGAAGAGSECFEREVGPAYLGICSYAPDAAFPLGHTLVNYLWSASNVAYFSTQYWVSYWDGVPSACDMTSTDEFANCFTLLLEP